MNKRARYARRVIRDHRRRPELFGHTRYFGPLWTNWACPRCVGRKMPVIRFDRPLANGQHRMQDLLNTALDSTRGDSYFAFLRHHSLLTAADQMGLEVSEERRDFDPREGLKKLSHDYADGVKE